VYNCAPPHPPHPLYLQALTFEHFGDDATGMFTTELLVEYGSIFKKMTGDRRFWPRLQKHGIPSALAQLLYSRDSAVLPLVRQQRLRA
jgi:hypothetical protein